VSGDPIRQSLSAELPPPRDGEPLSVRQDILDELADHLMCSHRRELLRGVEAGEARARALDRFGDPAGVARRLWLDAMKERLMLQRVVVATCLIVMVICVGFTGFAWIQMNRASAAAELERARAEFQAAEANRRAAEALAQSQATNQALLGQIGKISESLRHPRSPDWNPVRFKLVRQRPGGPPVTQATATLERSGEPINRTSDAAGIVDFGAVQPGDYRFELRIGWENGSEIGFGEINVQPGSDVVKTIICPNTPPDRTPVTVRWQWPADLEAQNVVLYADFVHQTLDLEPGVFWCAEVFVAQEPQKPGSAPANTAPGSKSQESTESVVGSPSRGFFWGPGSERTWTKYSRGLSLWVRFRPDDQPENQEASKTTRGVLAEIHESNFSSRSSAEHVELGSYFLSRLLALRPVQSEDAPKGIRRYEVLVATLPNGVTDLRLVKYLDKPLDPDSRHPPPYGAPIEPPSLIGLELPADYWANAMFAARPGQPNEWTIPVPDAFIKAVRDRLAEDSTARTESATGKPKSKP
jgi:hypothetical protein